MKNNFRFTLINVILLGFIIIAFFFLLNYRKTSLQEPITIKSYFEKIVGNTFMEDTDPFLTKWEAEDFIRYGENYYFQTDWDGTFHKKEEEVKAEDGTTLFKYYLAIDIEYINQKGQSETIRIPLVVSDSSGNTGLLDFRSKETPRDIEQLIEGVESLSKTPDRKPKKLFIAFIEDFENFYDENSQYPTGWFGKTVVAYYNQPNKKKQLKEFIQNGNSDIHIILPQIKEFYVPIN